MATTSNVQSVERARYYISLMPVQNFADDVYKVDIENQTLTIKKKIEPSPHSVTSHKSKVDMTIREFKANALFVHTTNKNTIYNNVCEGIVNSALDGIDGVVIAVGQQCSGKTYNMMGTFTDNEGNVNIRNRGIAPRLLDEIFKRSHSSSPDKQITIKISCVETRDNCVNDLLEYPEQNNHIPHSLKKLMVKQKVTNYRDGLTKLFEAESRKQMDKSVNYLGANINDFIFTIYVTVYDTIKEEKKSSKIHVIDTGGIQRARSSINSSTSCTANKMKLSLNTLFLRLAEAKQSERLQTVLKASKHLSPALTFCENSFSLNSNIRLVCHIRPESSYLELSLSTLSLATSLRMMPPLSIQSYAPLDDIELLQTYVDRLEEELEHTDSTDFLVSLADVHKYKKVKNVINFFSDSEPISHDSLPDWLPPIAYSIIREELRLVMKGTETKFNEQFKLIARQQIKDNAFGDVDVEKNYENWLQETEEIINKVDKLNGTVDEILLVDKLPIIDTREWSRFLKRNSSIFEDARYKKHKLERAQYSLNIYLKTYMERVLSIKNMRLKVKTESPTEPDRSDHERILMQNITSLSHQQKELHLLIGNVIDEVNTQILKMLNIKNNIDNLFMMQEPKNRSKSVEIN